MAKMIRMEAVHTQRKDDENSCPICHDRMEAFAVGSCDHPVCLRCATRMRVLCDLMYCPICRTDIQKIFVLNHPRKFESVETTSFCVNREFMIFFEDEKISKNFHDLLLHQCKKCGDSANFKDFNELRIHMQRQHELFPCDLCVNNIKLFSADRKFYGRKDLAKHRTEGDKDDRSYRGHPLCKFCDERYFDNDELLRHLRKQHFYCHFCENDGVASEYFNDYPVLREHFKTNHILCEEGECKDVEFTNAFRSEIDYRYHWSQKHSAGVGRQQAKQMRTIPLAYSENQRFNRLRGGASGSSHSKETRENSRRGRDYSDGGYNSHGNQMRERREAERRRREEFDQAHALSASLAIVQRQGHISVIDPLLAQHPALLASNSNSAPEPSVPINYQNKREDFPTLDGATATAFQEPEVKPVESRKQHQQQTQDVTSEQLSETMAKKLALACRKSVSNGVMCENDFPSLTSGVEVRNTHTNAWNPVNSKTKKQQVKSAWKTSSESKRSAWRTDSAAVEEFPVLSATKNVDTTPALRANSSFSSLSDISRSFSGGNLESMAAVNSHSWGPELNRSAKDNKKKVKENDGLLRLTAKHKVKHEVVGKQSGESASIGEANIESSSSTSDEVARGDDELQPISREGDHKLETIKVTKNSAKRGSAGAGNSGGKAAEKNKRDEKLAFGKFSVLSDCAEKVEKKQTNAAAANKQSVETVRTNAKKTKKNKKRTEEGNEKVKTNSDSRDTTDEVDNKPSTESSRSEEAASVRCSVDQIARDNKMNSVGETEVGPSFNTNSSCVFTADDFPTLPNKSLSNNENSINSLEEGCRNLLTTTLVNVTVHTTAGHGPMLQSSVVDGFPSSSLAASAKIAVSVPPGFGSVSKPPPGFGNTPPPPVGKVPPGFNNVSTEDASPLTASSCEAEKRIESNFAVATCETEYIHPFNAKERGVRLYETIVDSLGNENAASFREASSDFRQGKTSATEYHERCRKIMGHQKFDSIFPELVALLPDIPKQRQLLEVHREALRLKNSASNGAWSTSQVSNLAFCTVCGQVLLVKDKRDHEKAHSFDSEFPVLYSAMPCTVR